MSEQSVRRRQALQLFGAALFGTSFCSAAWAQLSAGASSGATAGAAGAIDRAFAAVTLRQVLDALNATPLPGTELSLVVPERVENGAVVPVQITSRYTGPQDLFILSEANPFPLVARFSIPEGTEPFISTRIKVAQSCNIYAVVKTGDTFYWVSEPTQVSIGGCGG
jgi:sulfur-oxidizing protein SoxY